jgi:hypothetical protein
LAYMHYWSCTLARAILALPGKRTLTVSDLRDETYITADDILVTLQEMNVLEHRKKDGAEAVINQASVRAWVERRNVDLRENVDVGAFIREDSEKGHGDETMEG